MDKYENFKSLINTPAESHGVHIKTLVQSNREAVASSRWSWTAKVAVKPNELEILIRRLMRAVCHSEEAPCVQHI